MTGPPAATAAVRVAVRRALADLDPGEPVTAAVSGGADSLALAAALAFVRPGSAALVVDHGLQAGSAQGAARAAAQCAGLGLRARVERVTVSGRGEGPARDARHAALEAAGGTVLLGHTLDDQAETVLLGLARGSGARALAGMAPVRGRLRRPLLALPRALVRQACAEAGLAAWEDPANADPAHARARVRAAALPALEQALGPGVAAALARSAALLREDADALDALAAAVPDDEATDVARLAALPAAVRARVLKARAERACGAAVTGTQVAALRALVERWTGQGPVALPGGVRAARTGRAASVRAVADLKDPSRVAVPDMVAEVILTEQQIADKVRELAAAIDADYEGRELLLVGVLKGAVMVMADLARALRTPVSMEFMAVSSYGSSTSSSGVVRILKDLDKDITGKHVLVVEDIVDSGLTLSWLLRNLRSRGPASVAVCALLRKPEAAKAEVPVEYVGFDIENRFVVGYGLDHAERYRDLPFLGLLRPEAYTCSRVTGGTRWGP